MCQGCDSDESPEQYLARVRALISRNRFVVQSVLGSRCVAEFSYTIGLTEAGLPELIVLGVRPEDASRLLHCWGSYLLDKSVVLAGETLGSGPWVLEAVDVQRPREHLLIADELYGARVRALQLVWADAVGRFPWDPGNRARRAGQPVLGTRAPHFCEEHSPARLDVPPHL